ncbi:oxysterol-binding protein [Drepanopeziza brunnea f. sp. 'multigermtubi' MB_m1]|uniref:Oxysterol-binding protein n=1 Tax=Marssonina brunnea f. sp. multigermtubi (strain MB_m1) TaxID=1072389 RepID=K1WRA8_MARBU|nr:oxysterol-binding protein [Drepanopeziza brunnea f. sp. 'multigermtubi' MB_m1]EKD15566.1 oxysterol-binding protein [Drepanopeziza brunnea f. sp. 'multigermtubi' MB_m1]
MLIKVLNKTGARSSVDESRSDGPEDETTVVEPDQGNVLSHIISQLRPGADLSRVVLPTFILEPRSMLERITNFMAHPETLLPMPEIDDPTERFVSVVKFYLSGWHIKPPGVKKPLNPILGETFTGYWTFPDNTKGYYISEQTSHHPPKSSYFYMAPEHHIRIDGCLKPRSKFLGNSAASMMEGIAILRLLNRGHGPKGERYILTQPNMYARGILFGKMKYELGDHSFVRCPELGLSADIEFKTKGYFGGTYNAIGGVIKNQDSGEVLYELSGMWTGEMWLKNLKTGKKELLFDATKAKHTSPTVRPLEEQDERESQKLWFATSKAVKERNHEVATDEKTKIEDMQRDEAAKRAQEGVEWHPRLFRTVKGGPGGPEEGEEDLDFILNASIDGTTPEQQTEQILAITPILQGQKSNEKNPIPLSHQRSESYTSPHTEVPAAVVAPVPALSENEPLKAAPAAAPFSNDLIDIHQGGPAETQQTSYQVPADLYAAQTLNNGQQQKDLENLLRSTSSPKPSEGPLLNFHDDLKMDLPSASGGKAILKREATDGSIDEFADAQG